MNQVIGGIRQQQPLTPPQTQPQTQPPGYTTQTAGTPGYQTPWRPGGDTPVVDWSHSQNWPGAGENVQQNWRRDPSWGGHVVWNPYWGFQDFPTIAQLYHEAGGPVTREQMMGWDLTQQPGPDWAQYYGDRQPGGGGGGGGTTGGGGIDWSNIDWSQIWGGGGDQDWGQGWMEGFQMGEPGAFPYPQQWGTASDVFTRFAQGLPTDVSQWWEAQQGPMETRISDLSKQAAEEMGLGGLRWSTPLQRNITDITGRETANLWSQLAGTQLGLTEAAKDRGMAAAGALTGLGQQYLNAPQDWAQRMYGMGAGMTGLGQQGLDRAYQDWLRMTAEQNPWLAQALGFSGMQSQMVPQQYQPSFLSQLLGLGTSALPFIPGWGR